MHENELTGLCSNMWYVSVSKTQAPEDCLAKPIYRATMIPAFAGRIASVAKIANAISASPKKIALPVSMMLPPHKLQRG